MRGRYRGATPYLLTLCYPAICRCGVQMKAGDQGVYYPSSRTVECRDCGRRTLEALADERMAERC